MSRKFIFSVSFLLLVSCSQSLEFADTEMVSHSYKNSDQISTEVEESDEAWKYQSAAWNHSYIGNYQECLDLWDQSGFLGAQIDSTYLDNFNDNYVATDAIGYITERSKTHQVVIINEAHHQPMHRVFTTQLLMPLYEDGYRYLGLETLDYGDTTLNEREYPVYSTGYYSKEPQFGNLIREALEIGFTVFPYEQYGDGDREVGQATNIINKIKEDSTAKYLIHCGFAHAVEGDYPSWGKAMAGRLKELSGIDPLTINQTTFTERSQEKHNHGLLNSMTLQKPTVFVNSGNESFKNPKDNSWNDIMIFHPKTKYNYDRPHWVFDGKQAVHINLEQVEMSYPYLVMAIKSDEDINSSVPCDIVEVRKITKEITLALKNGAYNILLDNGKRSKITRVEVK